MRLLFGCGYLGHRVALQWLQAGESVAAVTRSGQRAEAWRREGIQAIVADVARPETLADLPPAEAVVYAIGYDRTQQQSRRALTVDGLRNVLDRLPPQVERFVYTSSTGVIGNHRGDWVDEKTPCRPEREAARLGLEAEEMLREHPFGSRAIILRLAGLYGPGRIPKLADVKAGRPVAAPDASFLNLIHVDDAVCVVTAAVSKAVPPRTYLVSDGAPTRHREFYRELARQLAVAPPRFVEPEPGSRGAAAAAGNKRVANQRMLAELQVGLQFPSFREGLAGILSTSEPSGPAGEP